MITKKKRALLYLLGKKQSLTKIQLVKLLFLASQDNLLYDFVPYRYGPFSFQLYTDISHLERDGYLLETNTMVTSLNRESPLPDRSIQRAIDQVVRQFGDKAERELIDHIYSHYPETTIFSEIEKRQTYERDETGVVTIGYEGKSIDRFLSMLIDSKVGKVIDVRRNAFSMKYGFSKNQISNYLEHMGITYLHMPELGIQSTRRQNLTDEGYAQLFHEYHQELGEKAAYLNTIKTIAEDEKVALLCFEAKASDCHRGVIAERFREEGLEVVDL